MNAIPDCNFYHCHQSRKSVSYRQEQDWSLVKQPLRPLLHSLIVFFILILEEKNNVCNYRDLEKTGNEKL